MKPIAIDDFCRFKFLSNVTFSPEGKSASFVVTTADQKKNGYRSCIYMRKDGKIKKLTNGGKERSFQYLDENTLLFPGMREADADANKNDHTEGSMDYRNSLFLRRRAKGGNCEWRLLMTSGGGWKDADDMGNWYKDRARDVRGCLYVQQARFSKERRAVWMVCDPHIGTYSVVCSFDFAEIRKPSWLRTQIRPVSEKSPMGRA